MVPNGVSMPRPPALIMPPFATVWHTAQSPSAASCRPRAMVSAEYTETSGRAIGAIDRHGSTAAAMPTTAAHNAVAVANAPRRPANGFCHLSAETWGLADGNGNAAGAAA